MKQRKLLFKEFNLDTLENEAIQFLKSNITEKCLVGFSGGKDSIVTAYLMKLAKIDHVLCYSQTGIDPPEVVRFIKDNYPNTVIVKPKESFWISIPKNNPPLRWARWCCDKLKKNPSKHLPYKLRVMGIRAEESSNRAKYPRVNHYVKLDQLHHYPILTWPEWTVWEFIEKYSLKYPSLYEKYDRLGCVVCPLKSPNQTQQWKKDYPGYYKAFESACNKWYEKRTKQGRTLKHPSAQDFIEDWYKGKASWYEKK